MQNAYDGCRSLTVSPVAGRVLLSQHKRELGTKDVEQGDSLEVSRKGAQDWAPVNFSTFLPAQGGDILFFRKKGVTYTPGWRTQRLHW